MKNEKIKIKEIFPNLNEWVTKSQLATEYIQEMHDLNSELTEKFVDNLKSCYEKKPKAYVIPADPIAGGFEKFAEIYEKIKEESEWLKDLFNEIESAKKEYFDTWQKEATKVAFSPNILKLIKKEIPSITENNARICGLDVYYLFCSDLIKKFIVS